MKNECKTLTAKEWEILNESNKIDENDTVILKLYLSLLGVPIKDKKKEFLLQVNEFIKKLKIQSDTIAEVINPEESFDFSETNVDRIKKLVHNLKGETRVLATNSSGGKLFDLLAGVVMEALQYIKIIPSESQTKLENIDKEMKRYVRICKCLEKLLAIVQT